MSLLFIIIYSVWLVSEVLLNRLVRAKKTDKQDADKGSLTFIWLTIAVSITAAVFVSVWHYIPISGNQNITYAGLAVIVAGIALRLAVIATLGRFFTVDVTIKQGHQLKKNGFYKYLRHPSYFASLVSFIGFGISLNNWVSLAIVTISILVAFIKRIKVEEKALIEQFGEEYLRYKKTTSGLIPFIY
jgi:protein-S-isoprenylcysteine O-methyltransferase Ste14